MPILDIAEHRIQGQRRWTGRAYLPGRLNRHLLILEVRDGLLGVMNRCPHRPDMPMLMGRLDPDDYFLECPGHGWQMQLDGPELLGRPVVVRDGAFFFDLADPG